MHENLQLDSDFTYETQQQQNDAFISTTAPAGSAVTSLNGLSGPNVAFIGGASGFSFSTAAPNVALVSPLTTKGDLYVRNASAGTRIGVGADGTFLVADSAQTTGLKWQAGQTGWSAWTGTASRATQNADDNTTASIAYTQAEVQAIADRLRDTRRVLKALIDDLMTLKAIKA